MYIATHLHKLFYVFVYPRFSNDIFIYKIILVLLILVSGGLNFSITLNALSLALLRFIRLTYLTSYFLRDEKFRFMTDW